MDRTQPDFQPSYAQLSLATPLNLSQTLEGHTLTLKRAYADGHGLVIVVAADAEYLGKPFMYESHLTDSEGNEYPDPGQSLDQPDTNLSFKLPSNVVLSSLLHLHLDLGVTGRRIPDHEGGPPIMPVFEAPTGPFKFDFSIPYFPARLVEINQTVMSEANSLTLERLSITPSGVQVYLCVPCPTDYTPYTVIKAWLRLQTPDAPSPFSYRGMAYALYGKEDATGTISDHNFDEAPLYRQSGEWTLRVESVQYRDITRPVPAQSVALPNPQNGAVGAWGQWVPNGAPMPTFPGHTAIPGEWVFNFTVPPPPE